MDAGRRPISADFDDVRAGRDVRIGDTNHYYAGADRPPGLHVGVPPMPTHFFGREPLIAEVARRLVGGSTLALSADGLPGVGKTTLAVALAYRREVLDHFSDGVLWGALGLQPNVMEVLASWASALGIDATPATDPHARAALVRNAIGQRKLLLVIDDAWQSESAILLRCGGPRCAHFLTTRNESIARAFADRKGTVEIRELEPEHALELLTALAPEACEADLEAAKQLVAAVGYLPLAIELMGAYLSEAENRYFREQQEAALQRMADPAERLRQACKRLGDTRGTEVTLQETIRLSLQGLPDDAVAAFHALGAFAPKPETFDLEAAIAVTNASTGTLSRLLERHLLEQQDGNLSLHQTIADAAREETPDEAVQGHAAHYFVRVKEAGADWRVVETIYGQVKWSFSQFTDNAVLVLAFTGTLRKYQNLRGLREDGLRWNELEIQAARITGDKQREAVAINVRGWLHDSLGESRRALEFYQQALFIRRAIGDQDGEAVTLNNIGGVYDRLGERDRALHFYQEALPIFRAVGNQQKEAHTLNNIGVVYKAQGEYERALEFYQQALPICRAVGDRMQEAVALNNIGAYYHSLREYEQALDCFQQALPISQAIGDRVNEAVTLNNIGFIYNHWGEHERALDIFEQALSILRAVADRRGEAVTVNNIAQAYESLGKAERALELYQQALPTLHEVGDRFSEATTRFNIAMLYRTNNRLENAVAELRQVIDLEAAMQHPDLERDRRVLAQVEAELAERNRGKA